MKKRALIANLLVLGFCGVMVFAAYNRNSLMPYVWGALYGKRIQWNGIEVQIRNSEYFRPLTSTGALYIGDHKSPSTLVILRPEKKGYEETKRFLALYCKAENCVRMTERPYSIGDHRVIDFTFVTRDSVTIYQKYLIVEGKNVWIEYIGNEERYSDHEVTIGSVIQAIR